MNTINSTVTNKHPIHCFITQWITFYTTFITFLSNVYMNSEYTDWWTVSYKTWMDVAIGIMSKYEYIFIPTSTHWSQLLILTRPKSSIGILDYQNRGWIFPSYNDHRFKHWIQIILWTPFDTHVLFITKFNTISFVPSNRFSNVGVLKHKCFLIIISTTTTWWTLPTYKQQYYIFQSNWYNFEFFKQQTSSKFAITVVLSVFNIMTTFTRFLISSGISANEHICVGHAVQCQEIIIIRGYHFVQATLWHNRT